MKRLHIYVYILIWYMAWEWRLKKGPRSCRLAAWSSKYKPMLFPRAYVFIYGHAYLHVLYMYFMVDGCTYRSMHTYMFVYITVCVMCSRFARMWWRWWCGGWDQLGSWNWIRSCCLYGNELGSYTCMRRIRTCMHDLIPSEHFGASIWSWVWVVYVVEASSPVSDACHRWN